jgi:transcriptional regulator with XRE-family HTH domain
MMRVKDSRLFRGLVQSAGISQNELARRAGMSAGHVSEIRNGRKRIEDLDALRIASILGCRVAVLFAPAPRPSRDPSRNPNVVKRRRPPSEAAS